MFGAKPLYTVVVCQDLGFTIMHSPTKDGAEGLFEGACSSDQVESAAWYDADYRLQNAYSRTAANPRENMRPRGVPDATPLEELPIAKRAYHTLINAGHTTVGDVRRAMAAHWRPGDDYLLHLPNFGRVSLQEWKRAVW